MVYVYDAEHIEVKLKATAVMETTIDKFFASIGSNSLIPVAFGENNDTVARILVYE